MLGIIINPKSGRSTYRKQRLYLFNLLKQRQQTFTYRVTKYAGHAIELARELVEVGYDEILVLGGDGSLSEVIDGIMHANITDEQRKQISFGIMPRGTGNDWGRYWGLTRKYKQSLDVFFNTGKRQTVDVGCLTLYRNGEEEKHYFINSVGLGIDPEVCVRANVIKYYIGTHSLNYFFGLISAVFTHKSIPLEVTTDEGLQFKELMFTMNVGNGPFAGGGISVNPDANPSDGIFNVMFVAKPSFKLIMSAIPKLFNGGLKDIEFIRNFTAKQVTINTKEHLLFEKDGILLNACGPCTLSIIPSAMQMVVPDSNA